jgi:positive regulator of sigma E activity
MWLKKNRVPEMTSRTSEMEIGIVTALQDNEAIVELSIQESCESCGARFVCVPDQSGKRQLRVANPMNARVGSHVTITEKSNFLLRVSFLQYGMPFAGFLIAIFLLNTTDLSVIPVRSELILFAGGLAGLVIAGLISRLFIEKLAEKDSTFFEISKIVS